MKSRNTASALLLMMLSACAGPQEPVRHTRQDASLEASRVAMDRLARGHAEDALIQAQRARDLAASVEDEDALAVSLINLSVIQARLGRTVEARESIRGILEADGLVFPPRRVAEAAMRGALLDLDRGRIVSATRLLERSAVSCGDPCDLGGRIAAVRAQIAIEENRLGEALDLSELAREDALQRNDEEELANAERLGANALILLDRNADAVQRLQAALVIDKKIGAPRKIYRDLLLLGIAAERRADADAARGYFLRARDVARGDSYTAGIDEVMRRLGGRY